MKNAKRTVTVTVTTPAQFGYEDVQSIQDSVLENRFRPTNTNTNTNPLVAGLENASNLTTTANGALAYTSTLSHVLDFFGTGAALRTRSDSDVIQIFSKAFAEDNLLALKTLFYIRDRQGQGERKTFRTILKWLANNYPETVKKNLSNIPHFGRWDDLFVLFDTSVESDMIQFIKYQLKEDIKIFLENSLKSENAYIYKHELIQKLSN